MTIVNIPGKERTFHDPLKIRAFLGPIGIDYEQWPVVELSDEANEDDILSAYSAKIETLKAEAGYLAADVIEVTPDIPGLEGILEKFRREHWHDDDEVRFIVSGRGLFHISPDNEDVVSIELEAGDLIRIPSGTLHWFNVCGDRRMRAIRLFTNPEGWTPHYTGSGRDYKYQTMCFDDSPFRMPAT